MTAAELKRLESALDRPRWESELTRIVREIPRRMERHLETRATELSNQTLEAVAGRLETFRQELSRAMSAAQAALDAEAVILDPEKVTNLVAKVGERVDAGLARKGLEMVQAIERQFQAKEAAFIEHVEGLTKEYARMREQLVKEFETNTATDVLANTFRGNWKADTLYRRGETFSFRGGWHLVLQDARGQMPGNATLRGPAPTYALLASAGAPGQQGNPGVAGGSGGSSYVPPPLNASGSVQGQWTFLGGYMYWAVADGVVKRWAVTTPP